MARSRLSLLKGKVVIGYKKVLISARVSDGYAIAKLRIAHNARRIQPFNYKCRAASAKVLEITTVDTGRRRRRAHSHWSRIFVYEVGKIVRPTKKFSKLKLECQLGIHFFLTWKEALEYTP